MSEKLQALVGLPKMRAEDFERVLRVLVFVEKYPGATIRAVCENGPVGTIREAKSIVTKLARRGCLAQALKQDALSRNRNGTGSYNVTSFGLEVLSVMREGARKAGEYKIGYMQGRGAA